MASAMIARRALLGLLAALLVQQTAALPLPLPFTIDPGRWIDGVLHPDPGPGSVYDEVHCYGLPYGGFGFLSHVLSYYTAACLIAGRKPLAPWSALRHSLLDAVLCAVSAVITVTTSAFTIDSCRNSWPFLLVAVWKLTLSVSLNAVGLLASWAARRRRQQYQQLHAADDGGLAAHVSKPLAATLLYWAGSLVGLVGVFAVVHQTFDGNQPVRIITGVLVAIVALVLLLALARGAYLARSADTAASSSVRADHRAAGRLLILASPLGAVATVLALSVFYSDWILAAVQGNWAGYPADDLVYLYWIYFAAKRLPMLAL